MRKVDWAACGDHFTLKGDNGTRRRSVVVLLAEKKRRNEVIGCRYLGDDRLCSQRLNAKDHLYRSDRLTRGICNALGDKKVVVILIDFCL